MECRVVVVVIAAARVWRHVRDQFIACAFSASTGFDNAGFSRSLARGIFARGGANRIEKHGAHVGHKTWQRPWGTGDVEHRFIFERVTANHIHVDIGTQPPFDLWMGGEKCHSALDLRSPDKAQSAFGPWELARI